MQEKIYDLNSKIDFTLLDARATFSDLEKLCDIAYKNKYYSVCVNPCNVSYVKGYISKNFNSEVKVCAVVGFPLGANSIDLKIAETKQCIDDGADEIDFVVNIGRIKSGDFEYVKRELSVIRKVAKKKVLKCIIETCYLTDDEIVKISRLCAKCKIDYVKTSTGFGTAGADEKVLSIILNEIKGKCLVKASGGIRSREQAIKYLNIGADRIGTSRVL